MNPHPLPPRPVLPRPPRRRVLQAAAALLAAPALAVRAQAGEAPVLVLRHAVTEPGVGDPPGYVLDRCETQRNLSAEGREQALALGQRLAQRGARPQALRSSRWCRCLDTARLLAQGLGAGAPALQPLPALDSFFDARDREPAQTAALRERLRALGDGPVLREVWVTHQVNITALAGTTVGMGQALWLAWRRDGTLQARPFAA
jgi:broad specificity phosphatase PhoE